MQIFVCEKDETVLLDQLYSLFQSEWDDVAPLKMNSDFPPPIVAVEVMNMCGGLAFTLYPEPGKKMDVIWINALYVKSEYRGIRIASALIELAEKQIVQYGQTTGYVYTNIPLLYLQLGWQILSTELDGKHVVMSKLLNPGT